MTLASINVFIVSFFLFSQAFAASPPVCTDVQIPFFGEVRYGKMETDASGKKYMKKFSTIVEMPDWHDANSNEWNRVFIQVPPEKRIEVKNWSVKIHSQTKSAPQKSLNESQLSFGSIDGGFYPIKGGEFKDFLPKSVPNYPGQMTFTIINNTEVICQFQVNLMGLSE